MKSILVRAQIGRKEILVLLTPAPSILPKSGTAEHTRKFYHLGGERNDERVFDGNGFSEHTLPIPAYRQMTPSATMKREFPDALVPAEIDRSRDRLGSAAIGQAVEAAKS
jgi:hypothetical protein